VDRYPYHRLDRAYSGYRWWRPLLVLPLAGVLYVVFSVMVFGTVELFASTLSDAAYARYALQSAGENAVVTDPLALVALLAGVAVMAPALWLARVAVMAGGFGRMSSVIGRLRWRWLGIAAVPAVAYMAVQSLVLFVAAPVVTGEELGEPTTPVATYLLALLVILLLVPFQASAEEYVFRGFVLQTVGGWVRWWPVAVVVSAVPFVLGHLYNWWGLGEILLFALVTAWLTIRTGGLEAAIGVHVLNNVVAFGLPALGFANYTVADGSPEALAVTAVLLPLYALAVDRLFRRSGLSPVRSVAGPAVEGSARPAPLP
jgi:membrane protease YdiL (CAAX protease family)